MEWLAGFDWTLAWSWAFTLDGWVSLLTLTFLEIVLGIDNLVFLSIASQQLPKHQRPKAQRIGLGGALVLRKRCLRVHAYVCNRQNIILLQ